MIRRPQEPTAFTLVWAGQLVSLLGTSMTQFALTIWSWKFVTEVQPVADPATAMALVALFNMAPLIFFSPIAGALVDRWNRKLVMMVSDLAAGLATIAVFLLYSSGQLQMWHLYIAGAFTGLFQSFQRPAYSAAIATMISQGTLHPRRILDAGLNDSLSGIFAPVLAGLLLTLIGISGILLLDIITFLFAIAALLLVVVPQLCPRAKPARPAGQPVERIGVRLPLHFRAQKPARFAAGLYWQPAGDRGRHTVRAHDPVAFRQ